MKRSSLNVVLNDTSFALALESIIANLLYDHIPQCLPGVKQKYWLSRESGRSPKGTGVVS